MKKWPVKVLIVILVIAAVVGAGFLGSLRYNPTDNDTRKRINVLKKSDFFKNCPRSILSRLADNLNLDSASIKQLLELGVLEQNKQGDFIDLSDLVIYDGVLKCTIDNDNNSEFSSTDYVQDDIDYMRTFYTEEDCSSSTKQ